MIKINKNIQVPLYKQIKQSIVSGIKSGFLTEGQQILSPKDVSNFYEVSIIVAKQAFQELQKEGYIYSVSGTGTYIAPMNKMTIPLKYIHKMAWMYDDTSIHNAFLYHHTKHKEIHDQMYDVFKFYTLYKNHPVCIQSVYIPSLNSGYQSSEIDSFLSFLKTMVEQSTNISHRLRASSATHAEATLLHMNDQMNVFVVDTYIDTQLFGLILMETVASGERVRWETVL